jgi:hypothetical protein
VTVESSCGNRSTVEGTGDIHLLDGEVVLSNVLFVPSVQKTLIATSTLRDQGLHVLMKEDTVITNRARTISIDTYEQNGLTYIPFKHVSQLYLKVTINLEADHRRFGHASSERLLHLQDNTTGVKIETKDRSFCDTCATAKTKVLPFPKQRSHRPEEAMELITSDLKGPLLESSQDGYKYMITFNCGYSTWCAIDFLRSKSAQEVLDATKKFISTATSETNKQVKTLLTDNGSEYVNQHMESYLLEQGIKHQRTSPYSPQQNGQAERRNQTIMAMARCAIIESGVKASMWPFAARFAAYTLNRLPSKAIDWKTPHELWTGRKPDVKHLRPFGCQAFVHIDKSRRTSLEPTSFRGFFIGYPSAQKGWLVQRISDDKIFVSSNVTFNENAFPPVQEVQQQVDSEMSEWERRAREWMPDPSEALNAPALSPEDIVEATVLENQEETVVTAYSTEEIMHPRTFSDAMARPDAAKWREAAQREMDAHKDNGTWTIVKRPKGAKVIKGRWVFTQKRGDGKTKTYKARYVAKGFSQTSGVDYHETFAAVLTLTALRILMVLAAVFGWKVLQRISRLHT